MKKYLLDALLSPDTYPDKTSSVTLLQTHISYIFLLDDHVYKVKKPVDFGFLDFTTLEKRRYYCGEELRLNRRLSPDIYLEVVELRRDKAGRISFGGNGKVVEYAVKMARLPEERMMARLLDQDAVTSGDILNLARLVAGFHENAARSPDIDRFGSLEMIRANWQENLQQAGSYLGRTISPETLELIKLWVQKRLDDDAELIRSRIAGGFIRECDGDLHSENICLDSRIHIFDCIEFNEKFRYSDTAADVAFLVMDLENHNRRNLAELFIDEYISASGDKELKKILPLYLANRAFIRGKVESFRLDDAGIAIEDRTAAAARASRFFSLARGYILRERFPFAMIMTCAPTGCGKSSVAAEIAFQLGLNHFSTDVIRKTLAGIAPIDRSADIYTPEWNRKTYQRLKMLARKSLASGHSIVVDGTFIRRDSRDPFAALAREHGCSLLIIRPTLPANAVKQRLDSRSLDLSSVSDGTWDIYRQQLAVFEEPDAGEGKIIPLDATLPVASMVDQFLKAIGLL